MIDFLRVEASPPGKVSQASARMLIEFARRVEQRGNDPPPSSEDGVNSLRSAIKAFYHNGVCLNDHWPYVAGEKGTDLTIERSKEARKLALGAYFRLQAVLNDYHAALNEAGAIYVAANIHEYWDLHAVRKEHGRIPGRDAVREADGRMRKPPRSCGNHAFVVVGYDQEGFLVLNSWGKDWSGFAGIPGVAHWSYRDWSESVVDAWVLRLAVSTPEAFDIGVGAQGMMAGMNVPTVIASTPRIELIGHYVHLDDGKHVKGGRYPSSPHMVGQTVELLQEKAASPAREYQHVLLWLAGANEATKDAVADHARLKRSWMGAGVYPITVFWCSDFVEEISGMLDGVFAKAQRQVGATGAALDRVIETEVRGAGRAFLRDIKRRSEVATAGRNGAMVDVLRQLAPLAKHYRLHLVAEGVGAIMAADLAAHSGARAATGLPGFETVTLLSPALTRRRLRDLLDSLPPDGEPKIAVVTADQATEQRMRVGPYSQSILHLVDRAFEEGPRTDIVIGLRNVARRLRRKLGGDGGRVTFHEVAVDAAIDAPNIHHVTRGPAAVEFLCEHIGSHKVLAAGKGGSRQRYARPL